MQRSVSLNGTTFAGPTFAGASYGATLTLIMLVLTDPHAGAAKAF